MSATSDLHALDFVRRSLAERRQSRQSSAAHTAAAAAGAESWRGSSTPFDRAGQPPSPSSAAQFLAETNVHVSQREQEQHRRQKEEDEQIRAYWAWLAATSESNEIKNKKRNGRSIVHGAAAVAAAALSPTAVPSPTAACRPSSPQKQQLQRRISYYAGFLPETLDRDERLAAVQPIQRSSAVDAEVVGDAAATLAVSTLPTSDRDGESLYNGAAMTMSSTTGGLNRHGNGSSLNSRRPRRTTLSANFAGSTSGATNTSMARTLSVTFDETLAEAMLNTSHRMKTHQQQQQQRRRSSAGSNRSSLERQFSVTCDGIHARGEEGEKEECGVVSSDTDRVSPPSLGPFPPESSMHARTGNNRNHKSSQRSTQSGDCVSASATTVDGADVPAGRKHEMKEWWQAQSSGQDGSGVRVSLKGTAASGKVAPQLPWQQRSPLVFSHNGIGGGGSNNSSSSTAPGERERPLAWADGLLPSLADASFANTSRSSLVPQSFPQQQQQQEQSKPSASYAYSPSVRSLTEQSSRRSTVGRQPLPSRSALVDSMKGIAVAHNTHSSSSDGTDAQLSHHQLTEAFYGSHKGGKMARDAYLYFVAQQQQQQQQQSQKKSCTKRALAPVSPPAKQRGGSPAADAKTRARRTSRQSQLGGVKEDSSSRTSVDTAAKCGTKKKAAAVNHGSKVGPGVFGAEQDVSASWMAPRALHRATCVTASSKQVSADKSRELPPTSSLSVTHAAAAVRTASSTACRANNDRVSRQPKNTEPISPREAEVPQQPHTPPSHPLRRRPPTHAATANKAVISTSNSNASSTPSSSPQVRSPDMERTSTDSIARNKTEKKGSAVAPDEDAESSVSSTLTPAVAESSAPLAVAPAALTHNPKSRVEALWRRSERIFQQRQQQRN